MRRDPGLWLEETAIARVLAIPGRLRRALSRSRRSPRLNRHELRSFERKPGGFRSDLRATGGCRIGISPRAFGSLFVPSGATRIPNRERTCWLIGSPLPVAGRGATPSMPGRRLAGAEESSEKAAAHLRSIVHPRVAFFVPQNDAKPPRVFLILSSSLPLSSILNPGKLSMIRTSLSSR